MTPTDLITNSKAKFALGQARLRRGEDALALLSLHGSLEDTLRAHLLLHGHPAADGDWPTMLDALHADNNTSYERLTRLTPEEAERLRRVNGLRVRVAHGEQVMLPRERIFEYQQFAARLLQRYDVLVIAPETQLPTPTPQYSATAKLSGKPARWWQSILDQLPHTRLIPVLVIIFIFLVGAGTTMVLQQASSQPGGADSSSATALGPLQRSVISPTPTIPPNALAIGRTAFVRADVVNGLALRAQPGTAADIPVQLYLSADTAVEVVNGPVEADGYTWWQVRAANVEGWCAGEFLEVR